MFHSFQSTENAYITEVYNKILIPEYSVYSNNLWYTGAHIYVRFLYRLWVINVEGDFSFMAFPMKFIYTVAEHFSAYMHNQIINVEYGA